jgi:ABC-type nickel/cobalt efflux system permease component RcnA
VQLVSYGATVAVGALMLARAAQRARRRQDVSLPDQTCHHMLFALANDMLITGTVMVVAIAAGMAVTIPSLAAVALEGGGALVILLLSSVLFVGSLWA